MTVLSVAALWLARIALGLGLAAVALLAVVLVLLLVTLVLPFRFSGRWSRPRSTPEDGEDGDAVPAAWQLHLQWAGALLQVDAGSGRDGVEVRFLGRRQFPRPRRRDKPAKPPKPGEKRWRGRGVSWREWLNRGVLDQGLLLVKRVWLSLHLQVRSDLVLGFEDPSLTGLLAALRAVLPSGIAPGLHVSLDFTRPVLEGWVEAAGHGRLGSLVWAPILGFFSRPVRRIWMNLLRQWLSKVIRRRLRRLGARGRLAG